MTGKVLVTGGSGYIAGFLIRQLIDAGWTVNTTIRSLSTEPRLRSVLAVDNDRMTVFAADLENDAGWAEAMQGCSHVAHVASPFPLNVPKSEDEVIIPAREGALRALRFAKMAAVKRFVLTSSVAAIAYGQGREVTTFTEQNWTNVDAPGVMPYIKSKTIAERAARDWVATEGGDMEFCSVNPAAVLGPVLSDDFSSSIEIVKQLLDGSVPALPDVGFAIVDVRDLADLHIRALTAPDMAGERFIAAGRFMKMAEVAKVLRDNLGDKARKVPKRKLPDFMVRVVAAINPAAKQLIGELGNIRSADASHAWEVLGWRTRPEEESILDTANDLIARGIV